MSSQWLSGIHSLSGEWVIEVSRVGKVCSTEDVSALWLSGCGSSWTDASWWGRDLLRPHQVSVLTTLHKEFVVHIHQCKGTLGT